jgi:thiazole synthase ThiGH ThiG subunit
MTYDKNQDVLTIFDQAKIRVLPETAGATATEVSSGAATVAGARNPFASSAD